jgi:hypothetical protein
MTKSELFRVYNKARSAARSGRIDPKRLNKALGLAQRKDKDEVLSKYQTTINRCACGDQTHRPGVICNHRLEKMIETRASQLSPAPAKPAPLPTHELPVIVTQADIDLAFRAECAAWDQWSWAADHNMPDENFLQQELRKAKLLTYNLRQKFEQQKG